MQRITHENYLKKEIEIKFFVDLKIKIILTNNINVIL